MKKLLLILAISLSFISLKAEEEAIAMDEWYVLIGFEGGGGYYTLSDRYSIFQVKPFANSWGYNIAFFVGAQYFRKSKTSVRTMIGVRRNFIPNYGDFDNARYKDDKKQKKFPLGEDNSWELVNATDLLFNIQSTKKVSQGLLIGGGIRILAEQSFSKSEKKLEMDGIGFSLRLGYTAQIDNEVIELILEMPIGEFTLRDRSFVSSADENTRYLKATSSATTLAFSYKHLF